MTDAFAVGAARLAGFAGAVLGWRPDDFWRSTPAELAAIVAVLAGEQDTPPPDANDVRRLMEAFPDG